MIVTVVDLRCRGGLSAGAGRAKAEQNSAYRAATTLSTP